MFWRRGTGAWSLEVGLASGLKIEGREEAWRSDDALRGVRPEWWGAFGSELKDFMAFVKRQDKQMVSRTGLDLALITTK